MEFSINKKPKTIKKLLEDDGTFPNSNLPVLIYKGALKLPEERPAKIIEELFKKRGWSNPWRDGILDYHHYHSVTHEVIGVYDGSAKIELGGAKGIEVLIEKGDIIIIPAGVAHRNLTPDSAFKCVGAYPGGSDYDIKKGEPDDRPEADKNIKEVPLPEKDPVYGDSGSLIAAWK
jgi:uncharacterized protein YjlB